MIVIVLVAAVFVAWTLVLLVAGLLGRRTQTYRIETVRAVPPLPAPDAHKGVPAGRDADQDRIRAARARQRGGAGWTPC